MIDLSRLSPTELDRFFYLEALVARQTEQQDRVRALRDYYYGNHPVMLTSRQQQYLGPLVNGANFVFAHNLVRSVVDTLRERLSVNGFTVNGQVAQTIDGADLSDQPPEAVMAGLLWYWWNVNRMDSQQIRCHRRVLRDGLTYALVDFDQTTDSPRITLHKVDDGVTGVTYHRDPGDPNKVLFACKYFYTYNPLEPGSTGIERRTVYLPGEIRKYSRQGGGSWVPSSDPDDTDWPIPWVDLDGQPLGIPMIEFTNPGGSEMDQIIGLQNAVNKSWLDVIAAADAEGFPITVASYTGDKSPPPPPDDPTKALPVGPGRWVEVDGGTVQRLDGANLDPMLNVVWALVQAISGVSRTPQYYLKPVGGSDVPSGEALKQLDSGLVKRAEERQLIFGQTWTDVMAMCVKVNATFGTTSTPDLDRIDIATTWDSAQTRYELAAAQTALIYKQLGMPDDYVWSSTGAQPEQIASWKDQKRMDQAADIATLTQSLKAAGTTLAPAPPNQNVNPIPAPTNGSTNGTQNGVL